MSPRDQEPWSRRGALDVVEVRRRFVHVDYARVNLRAGAMEAGGRQIQPKWKLMSPSEPGCTGSVL